MPLKELVLYKCKELTGKPAVRVGQISKNVASGQHLSLFRGPYGAPLPSSPPHLPAPPGDIAALQNMPLEKLFLMSCRNLTGKPAVRVGRISKVFLQGNT